jgi:hypothetical protein
MGEQISGEHGFGDPDRASLGDSLESDSGTDNGHFFQHAKVGCRDVFVLGLRSQTIPSWFSAVSGVFLSGSCPLHGRSWLACSSAWNLNNSAADKIG